MRRTLNQDRYWVVALALSLNLSVGWSQSITWLGPIGRDYSAGMDVSDDGRVVIGSTGSPFTPFRASLWTRCEGLRYLDPSSTRSEAFAASADGTVIVGQFVDSMGLRAFRWDANSGIVNLGTLGGTNSVALDVSADGNVIVGYAATAREQRRAVRWVNGMIDDLGLGDNSFAFGVSSDGRFVVGHVTNAQGESMAFRWDAQTRIWEYLGFRYAHRISADGTTVVGWHLTGLGYFRARRWYNGSSQSLGTLGGNESRALGVSRRGNIVVGWAHDANNRRRAFRWTTTTGMQDLNTVYANLLTDGSELISANSISPNGRFIVGEGFNAATLRYEAFLLDTGALKGDVNGDGVVDDQDLLIVLFSFGQSSSPTLRWLGTLGGNMSIANSISADGRVVVGYAEDSLLIPRAYRWENGTMLALPTDGISSSAADISGDGVVAVGAEVGADEIMRACRWVNDQLEYIRLTESAAICVSQNGQSIGCLWRDGGNWYWDSLLWIADRGERSMGALGSQGAQVHDITSVSLNMDVAVGESRDSLNRLRAFRWVSERGGAATMTDIGTLGGPDSVARGVSANASVIVGGSFNPNWEWHAFRWENGRMENIHTLSEWSSSYAYGVSADGKVVVGGLTGDTSHAFRWTRNRGMEDLNAVYASLLTDGSVLSWATATSQNGRYIVGYGYNATSGRSMEAFLLDTLPCPPLPGDVNGDGVVDDEDLLIVLFDFGTPGG